jgi:hypothetical protein
MPFNVRMAGTTTRGELMNFRFARLAAKVTPWQSEPIIECGSRTGFANPPKGVKKPLANYRLQA